MLYLPTMNALSFVTMLLAAGSACALAQPVAVQSPPLSGSRPARDEDLVRPPHPASSNLQQGRD